MLPNKKNFMKKHILLIAYLLLCSNIFAETPTTDIGVYEIPTTFICNNAEEFLVEEFKRVKGVRYTNYPNFYNLDIQGITFVYFMENLLNLKLNPDRINIIEDSQMLEIEKWIDSNDKKIDCEDIERYFTSYWKYIEVPHFDPDGRKLSVDEYMEKRDLLLDEMMEAIKVIKAKCKDD